MKRVFYVALGATVGVLVVRKLTKTAEKFTPAGISTSLTEALGGLGDAIAGFGAEVRAGMAEREEDLRAQLGLDGRHDDPDALDAAARSASAAAAARYPGPPTNEDRYR